MLACQALLLRSLVVIRVKAQTGGTDALGSHNAPPLLLLSMGAAVDGDRAAYAA